MDLEMPYPVFNLACLGKIERNGGQIITEYESLQNMNETVVDL